LTLRLRSSNTEEISAAEYAHFYQLWGGSFIVHPDVLRFFHEIFDIPISYRGYFERRKCIGAVGTWGPYIAGDRSALKARHLLDEVDFGYPIIYLPIDPKHKCTVLYEARHLLNHQREHIAGALFTTTKRMSILKQIPDDLPTGKKEYQIKERRFERLGGTSRDIMEFSNDEIVAIYADLFQRRWNHKPHAIGSMGKTIGSLRKFLFGKVLWLDGGPVAIQINYRADTSRTICVDYVNGGVDKSRKGISPGSFLSYINGREACEDSRRTGKLLIYSYGKANTEYKDQWCNRVARGFTGFWLP
ncbi:MAG: GNAT family N-acetyltransferase, partial [Lacunisphaera sp.]